MCNLMKSDFQAVGPADQWRRTSVDELMVEIQNCSAAASYALPPLPLPPTAIEPVFTLSQDVLQKFSSRSESVAYDIHEHVF